MGRGALPNLIVVGSMKCGTSSLHRYLDLHPQVHMSAPKELNFFYDPPAGTIRTGEVRGDPCECAPEWTPGNWHRGVEWYARHFAPEARARGESSPGYTSPDHPLVALRMAEVVPEARLVYLVRDPIERAVSQYRHHLRDGTEHRPPERALLDPHSHYVSRSRYYARLTPFLERFPASRIHVETTERLRGLRLATLRRLFSFLKIDDFWSDAMDEEWHRAPGDPPGVGRNLRDRLERALGADTERLRELTGDDFPHWSV